MDLSNLPSRYSKISKEHMAGDPAAGEMMRRTGTYRQAIEVLDSRKDREKVLRPGAIEWKDGNPMFDLKSVAGDPVQIKVAPGSLQEKLNIKYHQGRQGQKTPEFDMKGYNLGYFAAEEAAKESMDKERGKGRMMTMICCLLCALVGGIAGAYLVKQGMV